MNSNACLSRGRSCGCTRMPSWPTTYRSPARTSAIGIASAAPACGVDAHAEVHLGIGDAHPARRRCERRSPGWWSSRSRRGRRRPSARVPACASDASTEYAPCSWMSLRIPSRCAWSVGAHPQHRDGDVVVGAADLEGERLELATEGDDVVHDLGHDARVDQVPLDADVFEHPVLHGSSRLSDTPPPRACVALRSSLHSAVSPRSSREGSDERQLWKLPWGPRPPNVHGENRAAGVERVGALGRGRVHVVGGLGRRGAVRRTDEAGSTTSGIRRVDHAGQRGQRCPRVVGLPDAR